MKAIKLKDPSDVSSILLTTGNSLKVEPFVGAVQVSTSGVTHNRGLIATRKIQAGECLFVTPPVLNANVVEVRKLWEEKQHGSVDDVAETVLVAAMQEALDNKKDSKSRAISNSFLTLVGADSDGESSLSIDNLLGKPGASTAPCEKLLNEDELRQIVRRNAFGSEFCTSEVIQRRWANDDEQESFMPQHILGLYPLAAMINHSCQPNAVRVLVGPGIMMVHASATIEAGQEIVWSYIPPTSPYKQRQEALQERHGFVCMCERCRAEKEIDWSGSLRNLERWNDEFAAVEAMGDRSELIQAYEEYDKDLTSVSNQAKRYLRVSLTNASINYLNAALLSEGKSRLQILNMATLMHFAFCTCDYASTEHISVLHVCYELICSIHAAPDNGDQSKTMPKLRFWTDQLKRAHQVRYGSLGNNLEVVRTIMQHSKLVLRSRNGMEHAKYNFI